MNSLSSLLHRSMSMNGACSIIKVAILYYAIQFLALQYQTVKLHRISASSHPPQTTNEIVHEEKVVHIYKKRNFLVASQIEAIEDSIADDEELLKIMKKKSAVLDDIRVTVAQIKNLESKVQGVIQNYVPSVSNVTIEDDFLNTQEMTISEIAPFLRQGSFEGYTTDELLTLRESVLEKISSIEKYHHMDVEFFSKVTSTSENELDCERFLTRPVSLNVEQQFATKEFLDSVIADLKSNMESFQLNPLDDETKILISQALTKKSRQSYINIKKQVDDLIMELKDFVAAESVTDDIVDHGDCVTPDDIDELLKVALGAYRENINVFSALSEIIDDLEESSPTSQEHLGPDDGEHVGDGERTVKDLLSLPLYPKVIENIDSYMEQLTGFSDTLDHIIDSMGGGVEGGVAKILGSMMNTIMKKVNNGMEFINQEKIWKGSSSQ